MSFSWQPGGLKIALWLDENESIDLSCNCESSWISFHFLCIRFLLQAWVGAELCSTESELIFAIKTADLIQHNYAAYYDTVYTVTVKFWTLFQQQTTTRCAVQYGCHTDRTVHFRERSPLATTIKGLVSSFSNLFIPSWRQKEKERLLSVRKFATWKRKSRGLKWALLSFFLSGAQHYHINVIHIK